MSSSRRFQFIPITAKPGMNENGPLEKYEGADAMMETPETCALISVSTDRSKCYQKRSREVVSRQGAVYSTRLIVGPGDETDRFYLLASACRARRRSAGAWRN